MKAQGMFSSSTVTPHIQFVARPRLTTVLNRLAPNQFLTRLVLPGLVVVAFLSLALSAYFNVVTHEALKTLHMTQQQQQVLKIEKNLLSEKHASLKKKQAVAKLAQKQFGLQEPQARQIRTFR